LADTTARALAEYLAALEAGAAPPREEFLARHPDLAEGLDAGLAALHFLGRAAEAPPSVAAEPAADVRLPDEAPGRLGDFRLVREVGRGGMGVVYEAEQVSLGRRVALKVLPFAATMDPRQLQRFHNEVRAAASLDHPHIVHVHAVGCERAVHYYAMQFIEGQTLAQVIAGLRSAAGRSVADDAEATTPHQSGSPSPAADTAPRAAASTERAPRDRAYYRRVAEWGAQAAEALDHAHALGIVHRDVKPANLLVDERGGLWVTDFGLAHVQSDARLTMTGDLVGTLRYMSPEQALAKRVVIDHRTDVYSLGATLYELLALEPAFRGNDRQELLRQIAFEEPRPPRRVSKAVPAELETIVVKAMEKNPDERYQTAQELADDLRRFLADEPIRARPAGVVRRLRKWGRRHRAAAAAAVVAAVVLSAGVGWVANDRATRRRATQEVVAAALEEAQSWQEKGRLPEALSAARRAQGLVAGGVAASALGRQVDARVADLLLLERLELVRLEYASAWKHHGGNTHFDYGLADRLYRDAFRDAGLKVEAWAAREAGERIRATTASVEVAAALDDWASARRKHLGPTDRNWRRLLRAAAAADPEPWRIRLREALERRDRAALAELARCDEAFDLRPATLSALAEALTEQGAEGPALALLRASQRRHPDDFWTNELLGLALGHPRDNDEAIRFFTAALAVRPGSPGAHLNLGYALDARGRVAEAIAEYRTTIDLKPRDAAGHINLAHDLYDKYDLDGAAAEFRTAVGLDTKNAKLQVKFADVLCDKGDVDGAIAQYRAAIAIQPKLVVAHNNLGLALRARKDLDAAVAEFRKAIALDPRDSRAHNNLGLALRDKKQLDAAIAEYHTAIALDSRYAVPHCNLGRALAHKGDLDGAIAEYRAAIGLDRGNAKAHYNLGLALRTKGALDQAIAEFRRAVALDPKDGEARSNLGITLYEKGDLDGALAECRKAVGLDPNLAEAHNNVGLALHDLGDLEGAIGAFRRAVAVRPTFAGAHSNLGLALADKGLLDEAIMEYRRAIDLDAKFAMAHNNLGNALHRKGDLAGAIVEYREAIDLDPKYATAHWSLGDALRDKGDGDGAIVEYRKAIDLDPKLARAQGALGEVLMYQGQFAAARTAIRRCLELLPQRDPVYRPCIQLLQRCQRLAALEEKLPSILSGKAQPASATELAGYAEVCQMKRRYAAASRLYREAINAQPDLVASPVKGLRYDAACVAALAGCGAGEDAGKLTDAERAELRRQALDWLRPDLDAWQRLLEKSQDKARPEVTQMMRHWLGDRDFNGVRGPDALGNLPEAEREGWRRLWADVADLLRHSAGKPPRLTRVDGAVHGDR
jgi:tetratricopeptide (TPR) repeat protein